ncbi:MAG TPA: DUF5678 domain-containing protein [Blastocatellia bacterium]|nr:DUF5678 domain-containing protein [Blastocatellia bacterium]
MEGITLEKVVEQVRQLSVEDQEKLRLMLNETPVFVDRDSSLPIKPRIISTNVPMKDRSRENEWLRQRRDKYAGQWVALDGDRLLAHGPRLKEVAEAARRAGVEDALMVHVEPSDALPWAGF